MESGSGRKAFFLHLRNMTAEMCTCRQVQGMEVAELFRRSLKGVRGVMVVARPLNALARNFFKIKNRYSCKVVGYRFYNFEIYLTLCKIRCILYSVASSDGRCIFFVPFLRIIRMAFMVNGCPRCYSKNQGNANVAHSLHASRTLFDERMREAVKCSCPPVVTLRSVKVLPPLFSVSVPKN